MAHAVLGLAPASEPFVTLCDLEVLWSALCLDAFFSSCRSLYHYMLFSWEILVLSYADLPNIDTFNDTISKDRFSLPALPVIKYEAARLRMEDTGFPNSNFCLKAWFLL